MAQRAPSPALPLTALPPGLAMGAAPAPNPQSTAAALQQAGLAPPAAQPAQQPLQQQWPADQGAALLAHLQNQARSNAAHMRPQDPSGTMADMLTVA